MNCAHGFELTFDIADEAIPYVEAVIDEIVDGFGMDRTEAVGRVNRHWHGQRFIDQDAIDALTHELPSEMARFIVYEPATTWWKEGAVLRVRPFP